ncbi:hypothetical protein GJ629_14535 [Halapricum sp. CBA1109]|uniref:hypothetical protein n=1 Tax=Halapricum sp. CBA1109 TaxID=2668068 RepID=UPI0012FCDF41|nr:hypothetical protein [Halapricum sp. CBA1109]MUV90956.1 hypothetical protein [Halapricum sp. CBA1109]
MALCTGTAVADESDERWNETYGDSGAQEATAVANAPGGGYVTAGYTQTAQNGANAQLIRTDADGTVQWKRNYGGDGRQVAFDVVRVADDYILAGQSVTADGTTDAWVARADTTGDLQWQRTYGSDADDMAVSVVSAGDGYAFAGWTNATGATDAWLVKVGSGGDLQWDQRYGGTAIQNGQALVRTDDGGFAIAGWTSASGGGDDALLIRTDAAGDEQWRETYGGSDDDGAFRHGLIQTDDGGFVLTGWTTSYGDGLSDGWLVETDSAGTKEMDRTYGGDLNDVITSVTGTESGYALSGYTQTNREDFDAWVMETDTAGERRGGFRTGGEEPDAAMDAVTTGDGGLAVAGYTGSYGAGSYDAWLLKAGGESGGDGGPPSIDPESYEIEPYPVETGVPPTVLVEASNADSVRVDAIVDGEVGSVKMTNVSGNKLWKADLSEMSDPDLADLGPGTRVDLRILAENDEAVRPAILNETQAAYPDSQLPTDGESRRLHYYTFENVIDLPVVLGQFSGTNDVEIPYDDPAALSDWQEAQEHDVNSYYGQGALGAVGFDFEYHDDGGELFDLGPRSDYDRRSLIEEAKTLPDADIDGPYVVSNPGEKFDRAGAYPDLRGTYVSMDPDVHSYGIWSHELGHAAVGVGDLYAETTCSGTIIEVCYDTVDGGIGDAGLMGSRTAYGFLGSELPEEFSVLSMTDINTLQSVSGPEHPWLETEEISVGSTPWSETITVESIEAKQLGDSVPVVDTGVATDTGLREFALQADDGSFGPVVDIFELGTSYPRVGGPELELATNVGPIDADPDTIADRFVERPLGTHSPLVANISIEDTNGKSGEAFEADVTVEIDSGDADTNTMRLDPDIDLSDVSVPRLGADETTTTPDLDLVATDSQGRRVGPTADGDYVVEIPGASASGDTDGLEWISVPEDTDVEFSVRTDGVEAFIEETGIDRENVTVGYETSLTHYDENPEVVEQNGNLTVTNTTTATGTNGSIDPGETTSALDDSVVAGFAPVPARPAPGESVLLTGSCRRRSRAASTPTSGTSTGTAPSRRPDRT